MNMSKHFIKVAEFTKYPGPRFIKLGPCSGEEFRETVLLPAIKSYGGNIIVDMNGVSGYGSSFLEEAFGGLIRKGIESNVVLAIANSIICDDEETIKEEVLGYVNDEIEKIKK